MKIKQLAIVICAGLFVLPVFAQEHPDFSGHYMPARGNPAFKSFPRQGWPYTEYGQQLQDAFRAEFDPDKDESSFYCVQPGMPVSMAQVAPFPIEVIHRDKDVTIFFEAWSQYRKIWMADHPHPEPVLASRMGYSEARWEGDTLVVEGSYLSERTMGRTLMSDQATFTERLHVETGADGQRLLYSELVFVDPVIYTQPIEVTGIWVESPDTPVLEYVCSETLYEEHLERVRASRD